MPRRSILLMVFSCSITTHAESASGVQPSFQGLGDIAGSTGNLPHAVSADGSTVVGQWYPSSLVYVAYRWTAATGMVSLGTFPNGQKSSAEGVSSDGSVIVGAAPTTIAQAARWDSNGIQALSNTHGLTAVDAAAVSADGQTIVGTASAQAMYWTSASGVVSLGHLAGNTFSNAYAVSGNGKVIAGMSWGGTSKAFRWTASGGMEDLGSISNNNPSSARGASSDGSVIVGNATSSRGSEAFRWKSTSGMQMLGDLPGGSYGAGAAAVSADGSVVVGSSESVSGAGTGTASRGYYWRADMGMVDVNLLLPSLGINLNGWFLGPCSGVSADGLTIVGFGTHNGKPESWIATVPEPASLFLLALGAGALLRRPAR